MKYKMNAEREVTRLEGKEQLYLEGMISPNSLIIDENLPPHSHMKITHTHTHTHPHTVPSQPPTHQPTESHYLKNGQKPRVPASSIRNAESQAPPQTYLIRVCILATLTDDHINL